MKFICKIVLGLLLFSTAEFILTGCVAGGGYVEGGGSVYYGPGPWFNDGPWLDGGHGYRHADGAYIHPPAFRGRGPAPGHPQTPNRGPDHAPDHHPEPNHSQDHRPNQDHH